MLFFRNLLLLAVISLSFPAQAALYDRGNGMIYDDVLDITWLQDANYAKTSGYSGIEVMQWPLAEQWAEQLVYGGYDDWRLPSARLRNSPPACYETDGSCDAGYNVTVSELGYMFFVNLGNRATVDANGQFQVDPGLTNTHFIDGLTGESVSFLNFQPGYYWYREEVGILNYVWYFNTDGYQDYFGPSSRASAWAVRDGDVGVVPVPGGGWLLGSALLGLVGVGRGK